jgi:hypothetical protein
MGKALSYFRPKTIRSRLTRETFIAQILCVFLLLTTSQNAFATDAFGLDAFKQDASKLTETKDPYKTRFGRPITVYTIPSGVENTKPIKPQSQVRFLVQGGLHGNELLASEFVAWLAKRFSEGNSLLNKLNGGNLEVDFVPYANPDGTVLYTRLNGNHINLNRNFSVLWGLTKENPGKAPLSEVESRAISDLLKKRSYTGAVDVHGYVNWIVLPTPPDSKFKNLPIESSVQVRKYQRWANAAINAAKKLLPGYEIKTAGGLGDGGSFEDFAWWSAGVPAFCLEVFSDQRHVSSSVANQIVDQLTPKFFGKNQPSNNRTDMFLVYENYIASMFQEAIEMKAPSRDIALEKITD